MWSVKDMFYGEAEPVWIMKPEKEDNKKGETKRDSQAPASGGNKKQAEKAEEYPTFSAAPYYPYQEPYYYYPSYNPPPPSQPRKEESNKGDRANQQQHGQQQQTKETGLVLKVPICCGECVESIEASLYRIKGVKSVECDTYKEKVTVLATTASPADILMECRKVFKKSRVWTDDD